MRFAHAVLFFALLGPLTACQALIDPESEGTEEAGVEAGDAQGVEARDPGAAAPVAADFEATRREIIASLGDRLLEFGGSEGNGASDAFLTTDHQLVLCASGAFGRLTSIQFSSSAGDSGTEEQASGRWTVVAEGGDFFVVLNVERSDADDAQPVERLRLEVDAQGNGFLDGDPIRSLEPAADACRGT